MPPTTPCGELPPMPVPVYRPRELAIQLNSDAVSIAGYLPRTLRLFELLQASGAVKSQSLRYITGTTPIIVRPQPQGRQPLFLVGPAPIPHPLPPMVDEIALLRVFFGPATPEIPSDDLINCLQTVAGVRFAERIPLIEFPEPIVTPAPPSKLISWVPPMINYPSVAPTNAASIAILDGRFADEHGLWVQSIIQELLPASIVMPIDVLEAGTMNRTLDTSKYFTALKNLRVNTNYRVINISRGGPTAYQVEADEMDAQEKAGVLVVAAAGNIATAIPSVQFPAAYQSVVSVGALTAAKKIWPKSSRGFVNSTSTSRTRKTYSVDVVAPGADINSSKFGPKLISGTSFACPMVAALAALIRNNNPTLSNQQIRDKINASCSIPTGEKDLIAWGRGLIDWQKASA